MADRVRGIATRAASAAVRGPVADNLIAALERLAPWRRGTLAVLTYHRVDFADARPDLLPSLISASPSDFAEQVDGLSRFAHPVSLGEVLDALPRPRQLPHRAVLVTFDDAYLDFAHHAWPILRAAGIPATLFVPTAYADGTRPGFWWDRLWAAVRSTSSETLPDAPIGPRPLRTTEERAAALGSLRTFIKSRPHDEAMGVVEQLISVLGGAPAEPAGDVLGWDELRRLSLEGVTLVPHTRTHPLLDRLPLDRAVDEIFAAHQDLEREVGPTPAVLAYPSGAHSGDAVEAARRAGMTLAFTTERGGNDLRHADPLRLRRINVGKRARTPLLRAQLLWASTIDSRTRRSPVR